MYAYIIIPHLLCQLQNPQNGFLYRKSSSHYHVVVPLGAKVIYEDYVVTIVKGERSLYQFTDILSIKVVDDLFGNKTFYGNIEDGLYGFGEFNLQYIFNDTNLIHCLLLSRKSSY